MISESPKSSKEHSCRSDATPFPEPAVTIVMPVHGSSKWLEKSLRSVVEQTLTNWEFLAYLDGENPEAESILKSFGEKFSYSIGHGGEGPAVSRNKCIAKAKAAVIAPLDSDDFWEPNHLAESLRALNDNPQLVLIGCSAIPINESGRRIPLLFKPNLRLKSRSLVFRNRLGNSGVVFRKQQAEAVGLYDPEVEVSHDYCLWLRLATLGELEFHSSRHFFYRIRDFQVSSIRTPVSSLKKVGVARLELADHLGIPRWVIKAWQWVWFVYRSYGPLKFLQVSRPGYKSQLSLKPIIGTELRIMHVINSLATGGAERLVVELCIAAQNLGHRPFIVCLEAKDGVPERLAREKNLKVMVVARTRYSPLGWLRLRNLAKHADIVHAHLFPAIYAAWPLAVAKVMTEHSFTNRRRNIGIFGPIERMMYCSYDRIIAISDGVSRASSGYLQKIGAPRDITTVKNATVLDSRLEPRKSPPLEKRIVFIGSLKDNKDPLLALTVMSHLADATLSIIGTGPLKPALVREARRLGISSRIDFVGEVEDVGTVLESHDLLLTTSKSEGFGLVALEAHQFGLPVVGPNLEGLNEVVISGKTGLLCDSRDPARIAALINQAFEPFRYRSLSEEAIRHSQNFTISGTLRGYIRAYKEVLGVF